MIELREYQKEAVQIGIDFFKQKSPIGSLMVCPTAWGKSILCAAIPIAIEGNTLVITTSKELLEQNYKKMLGFGGEASIYSASFNKKEFGKTTYATLQSLKGRGALFKQMDYTSIIFDEAHLAAKTDAGMFRQFLKDSGIKKVLGLTATPFKLEERTDYNIGKRYNKLEMLTKTGKYASPFKKIIYLMQIRDIVAQGFWSKLNYELFTPDTGELLWNTTGSNFTEESLVAFYENQGLEQKIFNRVMESDRKSILIFVPSVNAALELASVIPDSVAVWGDMPKKDRKMAIEGFKNRSIRVAINVKVLSVGFDYPGIDHIIDACPSAALGTLYQKYGRGTRICKDKIDCIITDFVGNINRFGRLEDLVFKEINGHWNLYSRNRQLTEVGIEHIRPLIQVGIGKKVVFPAEFERHEGREVKDLPVAWLQHYLDTWKWNSTNMHIREEILRIRREMLKLKKQGNV